MEALSGIGQLQEQQFLAAPERGVRIQFFLCSPKVNHNAGFPAACY